MPQPNYISVFPDDVWYLIFSFLPSTGGDRNSLSLSCKTFYRLDRRSRHRIFIGNCYSISPSRVVTRFEEVKVVTVKGKPHFADFNLVPKEWGGDAASWVNAMAEGWPQLEEIRFKRMILDDEVLDVIARKFRNLKILQLVSCEGFSMKGIASVVANCRNLRELDLRENDVDENCSNWLSCIPETLNSLVSLNISCLEAEVNYSVLERLVSRCSNLETLKLNHSLPLDRLANLLLLAPKLIELGTSRFAGDNRPDLYAKLQAAFTACKSLRCLSGIWEATPTYLPTIYPICGKLTSLNLSYAVISSAEIIKMVSQCKNLQRLWKFKMEASFTTTCDKTPERFCSVNDAGQVLSRHRLKEAISRDRLNMMEMSHRLNKVQGMSRDRLKEAEDISVSRDRLNIMGDLSRDRLRRVEDLTREEERDIKDLKSPGRPTELLREKAKQTVEVIGRKRLNESNDESAPSYDPVKSYHLISPKPEDC